MEKAQIQTLFTENDKLPRLPSSTKFRKCSNPDCACRKSPERYRYIHLVKTEPGQVLDVPAKPVHEVAFWREWQDFHQE